MGVPAEQAVVLEGCLAGIAEAARRIEFGAPLDQQPLADLDVSFTEFLAPYALPVATNEYMLAWAAFAFGCHPADLSTLHVLAWVAGFDNHTWAMDAPPADKFADGTISLVEALAGDATADVVLSAPVARIVQTDQRAVVSTRDGDSHTALTVVLATPLNTWHDIEFAPELPEPHRRLAEERQTGHAVKLWVLAEDIPERLVGTGWGGGINRISEEFVLPQGRLMVGLGSSPALLDLTRADQVEACVRQFAPDARVLAWDGHDWNADEFSQGTWTAYRPGQISRFQTAVREPHGRIVFAGSDVAVGWSGFMDGAIESGAAAAQEISNLVGHVRGT